MYENIPLITNRSTFGKTKYNKSPECHLDSLLYSQSSIILNKCISFSNDLMVEYIIFFLYLIPFLLSNRN